MAGYRITRTSSISESGKENIFIGQEGIKVPSADTKLTVGEVEKLTGVTPATLRHYDDIGLLCPGRTGAGVANNRKLYGVDDLARLQSIQTLQGYQFSLEEIGAILDGNDNVYEIMAAKLEELKRQETRLRNLIQFAKFVELCDTDLLEGLACGPSDIDELADLARQSPLYAETLEKLDNYSEEAAAEALGELDAIIARFVTLEESDGFAGVEDVIGLFVRWWNSFVIPIEDVGYLGFWVIFEDHSLVAEHVERTGSAGDAGFLQMSLFFACMKQLMIATGAFIVEASRLSDEDIVLALEETHELVDAIADTMLGSGAATSMGFDALVSLSLDVLFYMSEILADSELCAYLGLDGERALDEADLANVIKVLEVFSEE